MRSPRFRPMIAALAMIVVGLAAAVPALGTGKRATATTLTVMTTAGHNALWQAWVGNFQRAYPDITVNVTFVPTQSYPQTLLTELQAGNGPDLLYAQGGAGQLHAVLNLAQGGFLADLSSQPWVKRVPAVARPLFSNGKKFYALPLAAVPTGLMYNVAAFKQYGLTPPTTFTQLLSLCHKITSLGKAPMVFAGATFDSGSLPQMIAASTVYGTDPTWNDERAAGKTTFMRTAGWHSALQRFMDMKAAGCFESDAASLQLTDVFSRLAGGQALMWAGPSVAMAPIHALAPTLDLALTPFPGATEATTHPEVSYTDSLGVNAASPNKAAAIEFVNFIARQGQSHLYASFLSALSIHDANVANVPTAVTAFSPFLKAKKTVFYPNAGWGSAAVYSALGAGATGLFTGQVSSINTVLQSMDTAWGPTSG